MPYDVQGPTALSPRTGMLRHLFGKPGPSGFGSSSTASSVIPKDWSGDGKVILITGSNTGLGKEAARALAARGAEVVMAVRDAARGEAAAADIRALHPSAKLTVLPCDLSSLKSVRQFARDYSKSGKPIHVLIANAGVMACPHALSADGHELQFATNHLGHHLLVNELLPVLSKTAQQAGENSRVVVLSSAAHFNAYKPEAGGPFRWDSLDSPDGYNQWSAYGSSKLANILFTRELNRRLAADKAPVTAVCCHPGVIMTELGRHIEKSMSPVLRMGLYAAFAWSFKSIQQGAATEVYLATAPLSALRGGEYYADCNVSPSTPASQDDTLGRRLWDVSEAMIQAALK